MPRAEFDLLFLKGAVLLPAHTASFHPCMSMPSCNAAFRHHQSRDFSPFSSNRPCLAAQALYQADAGILASERCIRAHVAAAQACGALLHERETVQSWRGPPLQSPSDVSSAWSLTPVSEC